MSKKEITVDTVENLVKILQRLAEHLEHNLQEGDCDDENEDDEILKELDADLQKYQTWLWGDIEGEFSIEKALKQWETLHPNLPIPRIIMLKNGMPPTLRNLAIMLDAYPHYLAETKKG